MSGAVRDWRKEASHTFHNDATYATCGPEFHPNLEGAHGLVRMKQMFQAQKSPVPEGSIFAGSLETTDRCSSPVLK